MKVNNVTPPKKWSEAELGIKAMNHAIDEFEYDLTPSSIARRVAAENQQMFYYGILYGMALESGEERRLEERHYFE